MLSQHWTSLPFLALPLFGAGIFPSVNLPAQVLQFWVTFLFAIFGGNNRTFGILLPHWALFWLISLPINLPAQVLQFWVTFLFCP